tara:strand:- start:790 stop:1101 length:312 start_codon:yes stop_codon:yes gene_type:complete
MTWENILKARLKIIGSVVRQTISNHLEETGRKEVYEFEEIIELFPKYLEISGQRTSPKLKRSFESLVMRYVPEGYVQLRQIGGPASLDWNGVITGWRKKGEVK